MKKVLLIMLVLTANLNAELASHQTWLGGTMPGNVLGHREWDIEVASRVQSGRPLWGLRLEQGMDAEIDFLPWAEGPMMVTFEWNWEGEQGRLFQLQTRWNPKVIQFFADSIYVEMALEKWLVLGRRGVGLNKSYYPGDWELAGNLGFQLENDPLTKKTQVTGIGRFGLRSPYFFWTMQAGVDGAWKTGATTGEITPQLFINLPGDISLQTGATLSASEPRWSFILGYEIFPSP